MPRCARDLTIALHAWPTGSGSRFAESLLTRFCKVYLQRFCPHLAKVCTISSSLETESFIRATMANAARSDEGQSPARRLCKHLSNAASPAKRLCQHPSNAACCGLLWLPLVAKLDITRLVDICRVFEPISGTAVGSGSFGSI